jgi:hypothetical protein
MKLLDEDEGVLSLKPWKEVSAGKANKKSLALALRTIVRQAWGEYTLFTTISPFNLSYLVQSGRRGKITWGEIQSDPESLISPRFLLKVKLENPTRMPLKDITAYWNHWASKDQKGDPFSFDLNEPSEKGKGDDDNNSSDEDDEEQPPPASPSHYTIDDNIPHPSLCKTPSTRSNCLQQLVPDRNNITKAFHKLVEMVDIMEVSSMSNVQSPLYLTQF